MNPIQMLRANARRLVVVPCADTGVPLVYVLQRLPSAELFALAAGALAAATGDAERADELRSRLLGAKTDEDRARITAEVAEGLAASAPGPAEVLGMLERADALVQATVIGVGFGLEELELQPGLLPAGTDPATVCQSLGQLPDSKDPTWFQSIAWGSSAGLKISDLAEMERMALAHAAVEAFSPAKAASTFPGLGADGARGRVGPPVQPEAVRADPGRRPRKNRDRSGGASGR